MKKTIIAFSVSFIYLIVATVAHAGECKMPSGKTWKNELGSELNASVDSSGKISGAYKTAVGCGKDKSRTVTGFCNGYAVTFSVDWQECVSTTSWSGTYEEGSLKTLWQLVLAKKPGWDSIIAGTDTFNIVK